MFKGTIQDWEATEAYDRAVDRGRLAYVNTDVCYYLGDWSPKAQREHDTIYSCGANFPDVPGKYLLPFREGSFVIQNGRVMMTTRGSSVSYEHPLVHFQEPTKVIDFGWYTMFFDARVT